MYEKSIYQLSGVIHIHFPLRRVEKYISKIIDAGKKANVDFIILTTHTPKKNKNKYKYLFDLEGYYGNILLIHGEEIDEIKKNHCLVIGNKTWNEESKNKNLLKFIAHPFGRHRLFLFKKDYRWEKWNELFDGIEVWSLLFEWAHRTKIYNLPLRYIFFPHNLDSPKKEILKKWDELNLKRKVSGFAGLDIHALPFIFKIIDIKKCFDYKNIFKILRNHVFMREDLTGNFEKDKIKLLKALKEGNFYFANDFLYDSKNFYFGENKGKYTCGQVGFINDIILIRNPIEAKTNILKNGKIIFQETIKEKEIKIKEKGNYRVEVSLNGKDWIFTNNIYIRE